MRLTEQVDCVYCGQTFWYASEKWRHIKEQHSGDLRWHCRYCDARFDRKGPRSKHELIHTGDKPYECEFCGKRWKNKTSLKRHVLTHTGEKPYECMWCEKGYNQSTLLKKHCRREHGIVVKFRKGKPIVVGNVHEVEAMKLAGSGNRSAVGGPPAIPPPLSTTVVPRHM